MPLPQKLRRPELIKFGLFCLCLAAFGWFAWCAPLTSDDYEFGGLRTGLSGIIKYALYYGNGRFLGNLGSIILSKMPLLETIVTALLLSGMVFLVPAVLGIRKNSAYFLSFLLFITIPASLFSNVYTMVCGFQNYIPPIWAGLLILFLIQQYDRSRLWGKILICAAIFLLGLAGQLYVEHSTLINLLLALCLTVCRLKSKGRLTPVITWLIAAAAGLAVMLLIPKVFYVASNRTEGYRGLDLGLYSIVRAFSALGGGLPPVGSLILAVFAAITTRLTHNARSTRRNTLLYLGCLLCAVYILANELLLHNSWFGKWTTLRDLMTALALLMPYGLWLISLRKWENKALRRSIFLLLMLALVPLVPLLVVYPVRERVVFHGFVFTIMAILLFSRELASGASPTVLLWVSRGLSCSTIVITLLLCTVFFNIFHIGQLRKNHIRHQMAEGKTAIAICPIPYDYYYWDSTWCYGRYYYYDEWYDIDFIEMDYYKWYENYQAKYGD